MIRTITLPYVRFPALNSPAFPLRTFVDRPAIATKIECQGSLSVAFYSIIDSGADSCTFPSVIGRQIGMNISSGMSETTMGAAGSGVTYYHSIKVHVEIKGKWVSFNCFGGFLDGLDQIGFGLLGHKGFFNLFESVSLDSKNGRIKLAVNVP